MRRSISRYVFGIGKIIREGVECIVKKQLFGLLAVLSVTVVLALTVYGAGIEGSRDYTNQGFSALSIASGMKLEVIQGEEYEVTVHTKKSQLEMVKVKQAGEMLGFSLPPFTITTGPIKIFITMPELTKLELSGGSKADMMMDVTAQSFVAGLSGGSEMTGSLQARRLELYLSGGSRSSLSGAAETMKVYASGGSEIRQESFQVEEAGFNLSGGCRAYVFVKEMIEVNLSGGSQVYYHGRPRLGGTSFSGGSGIRSLE